MGNTANKTMELSKEILRDYQVRIKEIEKYDATKYGCLIGSVVIAVIGKVDDGFGYYKMTIPPNTNEDSIRREISRFKLQIEQKNVSEK